MLFLTRASISDSSLFIPPSSFSRDESRVPRDVSLTGFDDMELAEYSEPAVTTIAVDKLAIGTEAAELALRCMRNRQPLPAGTCLPRTLPYRALGLLPVKRRKTVAKYCELENPRSKAMRVIESLPAARRRSASSIRVR